MLARQGGALPHCLVELRRRLFGVCARFRQRMLLLARGTVVSTRRPSWPGARVFFQGGISRPFPPPGRHRAAPPHQRPRRRLVCEKKLRSGQQSAAGGRRMRGNGGPFPWRQSASVTARPLPQQLPPSLAFLGRWPILSCPSSRLFKASLRSVATTPSTAHVSACSSRHFLQQRQPAQSQPHPHPTPPGPHVTSDAAAPGADHGERHDVRHLWPGRCQRRPQRRHVLPRLRRAPGLGLCPAQTLQQDQGCS